MTLSHSFPSWQTSSHARTIGIVQAACIRIELLPPVNQRGLNKMVTAPSLLSHGCRAALIYLLHAGIMRPWSSAASSQRCLLWLLEGCTLLLVYSSSCRSEPSELQGSAQTISRDPPERPHMHQCQIRVLNLIHNQQSEPAAHFLAEQALHQVDIIVLCNAATCTGEISNPGDDMYAWRSKKTPKLHPGLVGVKALMAGTELKDAIHLMSPSKSVLIFPASPSQHASFMTLSCP